jgi:hypothetical protein
MTAARRDFLQLAASAGVAALAPSQVLAKELL